MASARTIARVAVVSAALHLITGCRSARTEASFRPPSATLVEAAAVDGSDDQSPSTIIRASQEHLAYDSPAVDDPFADRVELDLTQLTAEVLKRNPTIQAMVATWQAAAQRYPQSIAFDDPMFGFMVGPASLGSNDVDFGWMVEGSQKIPWPGKRQWRGQAAQAEADATFQDVEDARLKLAEMTTMAFLEYFVADRELELNIQNVDQLKIIHESTHNNLVNQKVSQRDVVDVEVQLKLLDERQVELRRMRKVAAARINTLLHRVPDHPLPPPPASLPEPKPLPAAGSLRKLALERRPDLAALGARIRAEEAAVEVASREFYPDLEFVARYDGFWQGTDRDLAPQIGMNLNLPLQKDRRRAAVNEAIQNVTRRRAEYLERADAIQEAVEVAVERLVEARAKIDRYAGRPDGIIAKAELSAESAQIGYRQAATDFLRLIDSQRQLIGFRDKLVEAEAEYHRRLAELERTIGGAIPATYEIDERHGSTSRPDEWRAVADGPALK
jgi:outer membrane protein TolC